MQNLIVGVDPGKKGGVAVYNIETKEISFIQMPINKNGRVDIKELVSFLSPIKENILCVYVEKVTSFKGESNFTGFNFGASVGALMASFDFLNIPFDEVLPRIWQGTMWTGIDKIFKQVKSKLKHDTKATSLKAAQRLFPECTFLATPRSKVPHDGIVDAVLIAYYAYLQKGIN